MGAILKRSGVAVSLLLSSLPLTAHHSMSATFDLSQRFTWTGTLIEVDWRNPHLYLYVEVLDEQEQVETWAFEGPSPTAFRNNENVGKSDFEAAVGQVVSVEASRARDGSLSGLIRALTFPDGDVISVCPNLC